MFDIVLFIFIVACLIGMYLVGYLVGQRSIMEGTPSASHNTDMVHGAEAQICPECNSVEVHWSYSSANFWCEFCGYRWGKLHHV